MLTRTMRAALPVLLAALPLTACASGRTELVLPPVERAAPVAYPTIPAGEAVCDGQRCLSDRETGELIRALAAALDDANARLAWLRTWIATANDHH